MERVYPQFHPIGPPDGFYPTRAIGYKYNGGSNFVDSGKWSVSVSTNLHVLEYLDHHLIEEAK